MDYGCWLLENTHPWSMGPYYRLDLQTTLRTSPIGLPIQTSALDHPKNRKIINKDDTGCLMDYLCWINFKHCKCNRLGFRLGYK